MATTIRTYRNKRNNNKYIDVKHTSDGHYLWRQRMVWDNVGVENHIGTPKGGYRRVSKRTVDEVLADYVSANYCNVPGIIFIYHNEWEDPELIYKGIRFNVHELEDTLWADYAYEFSDGDIIDYADWVCNNVDYVYELADYIVNKGS